MFEATVDDVSTFRLYLMRLLYLLNFVLLGLDVWPAIVRHASTVDPVKGAAFAFWAALSLLSGLGFRYPLGMVPLLLLQMTYKTIWALSVALPQWSALHGAEITRTMIFGAVVDLFVIPWPYVVARYVVARGDRWRPVPSTAP